jgi:hypothetical protein
MSEGGAVVGLAVRAEIHQSGPEWTDEVQLVWGVLSLPRYRYEKAFHDPNLPETLTA